MNGINKCTLISQITYFYRSHVKCDEFKSKCEDKNLGPKDLSNHLKQHGIKCITMYSPDESSGSNALGVVHIALPSQKLQINKG